MAQDGTTLITDIGLDLIRTASGDASQVAISHIALGDGLGALYAPAHSQTTLRRKLTRVAIERRMALGNDSWRVKAEFIAATTPAFTVREAGFFDEDGNLIAIWAGLDVLPRQTGVVDYLVEHVLNFSRVASGLVIIDAPDDDLFDLSINVLANLATQSLAIFNLTERIAP